MPYGQEMEQAFSTAAVAHNGLSQATQHDNKLPQHLKLYSESRNIIHSILIMRQVATAHTDAYSEQQLNPASYFFLFNTST